MNPSVRSVEVLPPSRGAEARVVLRAAMAIVLGALLFGAWRRGAAPDVGADLLPYQVSFRDLAPELQRVYRELLEGVVEAENARAETGVWPTPEALAEEGVPPFAADPLRATELRWTRLQDGPSVSYRGVPAEADAPELLVLIQEPDPRVGERFDPTAPPDETHHRLPDGSLLHVTLWYRPRALGGPIELLVRPFTEGFLQILAGTTPG